MNIKLRSCSHDVQKFSLLIFFFILCTTAQASDSDDVLGVWINAAKDGYIQITKNGDLYDGAIVGGPNPEDANRLDSKNPDPALRERPLQGLRILQGFEFNGRNRWIGGSIYDPNNGKTYKCRLELKDAGHLKVRGFIGVSLFGRTEIWVRKEAGERPSDDKQ